MGNILSLAWQSLVMPIMFLSNPYVAILCLAGCILIKADSPSPRLLQFLIPFGLSQALLALAGLIPGRMPDASGLLIAFLCIQIIVCGVLIYRLRQIGIAASMLALFCVSYAVFASVAAGMSLQNTWP